MNSLKDNRFAPLTFGFGFIEAPFNKVCNNAIKYLSWARGPLYLGRLSFKVIKLNMPFEKMLLQLLPICRINTRKIFISTNSSWVAYLDNGIRGSDPESVVSVLTQRLNCRGLNVYCVPETYNNKTKRGASGGVGFSLYGPKMTNPWSNYLRTVHCINEGKWIFETNGTPQPFEQLDKYNNLKIKERFTCEMLENYCMALGVELFDADFYRSEGMLIIDRKVLREKWNTRYSLREAQEEINLSILKE